MKKGLFVIGLSLLFLFASACTAADAPGSGTSAAVESSSGTSAASTADAIQTGASAAGTSTMSTETQKNVTIVLDENPTTGYTWAYTIDNPQVLQYTSDSYAQNPAASGLVGVGGQHTYVFSAVGPGTAIITFSLGQQWSGGTKDAQIAKYQVVVGQDGNISSQKKTQ